MKVRKSSPWIWVLFLLISQYAYPQIGSLDSTFGENGFSIVDMGRYDGGNRIGTTEDGKILLAGLSSIDSPQLHQNLLLQFRENGRLDRTFGKNGIVYIDSMIPHTGRGSNRTIGIHKDQKLVVAVSAPMNDPLGIHIYRYLKDGQSDLSFGNNGKQYIPIPDVENAIYPTDLKIQHDGKILILGREYLIRVYEDGSLDRNFGIQGIVRAGTEEANAMAIQADGKIIVFGSQRQGMSSDADYLITRYNSNGQIDATFGENGSVIMDINGDWDRAADLKLQFDGKILVLGTSRMSNDVVAVFRLNKDGSRDEYFGIHGQILLQVDSTQCEAASMIIQPDNKILIAGNSELYYPIRPFVLRLLESGLLDKDFGDQGIASIPLDLGLALDITLQRDGKILVGGIANFLPLFQTGDFLLIRLNSDLNVGTVDETPINFVEFYPNPVSEYLTLKYTLLESAYVRIRLVNSTGSEIATLFSGEKGAGEHSEDLLLPGNLVPGHYLINVLTQQGTRSMWIVKN